MTIRLLTAWDIYPQNAIVTLTPPNEAGLIAAGNADANLDGGDVYTGPKGQHWAADEPPSLAAA